MIVRKAIAERMIIRKTIVMVAIAGGAVAVVVVVRKVIVVISGNRMIMSDIGMVPMTDRLVSIDRIIGNLATTRSGRPIPLAVRTTLLVPILVMIKTTLNSFPICQSPPLMAI